ncbi:hypothetical protein [Rhodococcus qingshengii]|uniref:hypothetical protein n=1 Tax=Rhodococcus qingshengii TaxID=334542 RepID=UPI0018DA38BE|nr:hypothetical protein [Rhodococcus qingshengii]QPG90955.1 hypothetical protein I1G86_06755 [Rhodococcus qingshengii]
MNLVTCPNGHTGPSDEVPTVNGVQSCPICGYRIERRSLSGAGTSVLVALGLVAVAMIGWAAVLLFIPLPAQNMSLGSVGTCGPGYSSESALSVRMNPNSVVEGQQNVDPTSIVAAQEQQEWVDYCVGVADSRIKLSAVIGVVGVLVGAATVVLSTTRPRWLLRM